MAIVDELERFLDDYQAALAAFDSERSAALWGLPGMILSDEFAGALDSRELMARGLAQSYPLYRELGMGGVEHTLLEHAALTERMARLRVRRRNALVRRMIRRARAFGRGAAQPSRRQSSRPW